MGSVCVSNVYSSAMKRGREIEGVWGAYGKVNRLTSRAGHTHMHLFSRSLSLSLSPPPPPPPPPQPPPPSPPPRSLSGCVDIGDWWHSTPVSDLLERPLPLKAHPGASLKRTCVCVCKLTQTHLRPLCLPTDQHPLDETWMKPKTFHDQHPLDETSRCRVHCVRMSAS
jgi:hypothetical protein